MEVLIPASLRSLHGPWHQARGLEGADGGQDFAVSPGRSHIGRGALGHEIPEHLQGIFNALSADQAIGVPFGQVPHGLEGALPDIEHVDAARGQAAHRITPGDEGGP